MMLHICSLVACEFLKGKKTLNRILDSCEEVGARSSTHDAVWFAPSLGGRARARTCYFGLGFAEGFWAATWRGGEQQKQNIGLWDSQRVFGLRGFLGCDLARWRTTKTKYWAVGFAEGFWAARVFGLRPGEVENNKNKILGCGIRRGFLGCEVENNKNKIFR
jgi:hypothetical protein